MSNFENINKYLTLYKLGKPVLTGSGIPGAFDSYSVDCPFVFFHQNRFHMLYIGFDGIGYQTGLAVSDDLLNWRFKGVVLKREDHGRWDSVGAAGTWILKETNDINDILRIKKVNNKYWMIYHSYPEKGLEHGPAQMGLAWTEDENLLEWHRLEESIYSWEGGDDWEKGGLYKACLIEHENMFYMFYNAKNLTDGPWVEQIGVAISSDLLHWKRFDGNPVIRVSENGWDKVFCSDPCVVKDGRQWIMFYFGLDANANAQDGIAVSDDLISWEKYPEPILRNGAKEELDEIHAHKPSVICHNDVLYHFYCACRKHREGDITRNGNEFRCITVAASSPLV